MTAAARKMVPLLVAIMAWAFSTYLIIKGLKKIWKFEFHEAALIGLVIAVIVYLIIKPRISKRAATLTNRSIAVRSGPDI